MAGWNSYTYTGVAGHSYEPARNGYFHLNDRGQYVHAYHQHAHTNHDRDHRSEHRYHETRHTVGAGGHHHHEISHHSHNHVSNPNVSDHGHIQEHSGGHHTYIHHQRGKTHERNTGSSHLPEGHVVTHNGKSKQKVLKRSSKPLAGSKQPLHPRHTPGTVTSTPKPRKTSVAPAPPQHAVPGTTTYAPKTTSKGPLHPGINFGTFDTTAWDPNASNRPGEGVATHISAVDKNGKVPTTSTNSSDPQGGNLVDWWNQQAKPAINNVLTGWANVGVWEENTFGGGNPYTKKPANYYTTPQNFF